MFQKRYQSVLQMLYILSSHQHQSCFSDGVLVQCGSTHSIRQTYQLYRKGCGEIGTPLKPKSPRNPRVGSLKTERNCLTWNGHDPRQPTALKSPVSKQKSCRLLPPSLTNQRVISKTKLEKAAISNYTRERQTSKSKNNIVEFLQVICCYKCMHVYASITVSINQKLI